MEDITERKIAEAKINHLARFDSLTGLPNRTILRDRMERALAEWRPDNMCAIHFIDLDQFKQVNDTLGHTRGDMLLSAVAERLQSTVRDSRRDLALRRRRIRRAAAPLSRSTRRGAGQAHGQGGQRHLRDRRPQGGGHRQHRNRAGDAPRSTRTSCCATPTWRCTGRRPRAAAHGAGSRPRWKPRAGPPQS